MDWFVAHGAGEQTRLTIVANLPTPAPHKHGEGHAEESAAVLSEEKQERTVVTTATSWSAPLPPPDALKQYPENAQKIILDAFQGENKHRHKMQGRQLDARIAYNNAGQRYAFICAMASLIISGLLVFKGYKWGAAVLAGLLLAIMPQIENLVKMFSRDRQNGAENESQNKEK